MANILIVEDEKSTVALLTRALTQAGHTVTAAGTGKEAIAKAKAQKPALIMMDMSLPEMTGFEATRALKADAATRDIPVLGLSGATTQADRDEAYSSGCEGYVTKPIDMPALLARVKELAGA
jgi:two-component system cell cycle response regulator DivK